MTVEKIFAARRIRAIALALVLPLVLGTALAAAETVGMGNLEVTVTGSLSPHVLPRSGEAPVAVSVAGHIATTDGSQPPRLEQLKIEINSHGRLDLSGLPTCNVGQIQPASNSRALAACRDAKVGQGSFSGTITLPGSEPYPTNGPMLVFNGGRSHGHQILLGHIYNFHPFSSSFVIIFEVSNHRNGTYGTTLTANMAKALGNKRSLTEIKLTLSRRYSAGGGHHSFISANCPAPAGFRVVSFPLARTMFTFVGNERLTSTLTKTCGVR